MAALTNTAETRALRWLLGQPATAPVLPLRVALLTGLGDDATPGAEVTGGGYARQDLSAAAVVAGASGNDALLRWDGLVNPTTVVGVEVWDSAGAPVRWWHGPLAEQKTVIDGVLEIPVGDLGLSLD